MLRSLGEDGAGQETARARLGRGEEPCVSRRLGQLKVPRGSSSSLALFTPLPSTLHLAPVAKPLPPLPGQPFSSFPSLNTFSPGC